MSRSCARVAALLLGFVAFALAYATTKYKAAPSEVALLPKFCWAQYMENVEGPEYGIPIKTCGYAMNHYCIGLVELIRANRSFANPGIRKQHLMRAREDTLYTLRGMKDYPACPIRAHAESTLRQVETGLRNLSQ